MSAISVRPLCSELAKKAMDELNETPNKLEEGIKHLKEWIAKQPHLRARTDDQWLVAFLRGCKHSLERTKEKIDLFYTMRSVAPELTALKYCQPEFKDIARNGYGLILPKRLHPADPRVVIVRASHYDPNRLTVADVFAVTQAIQMINHMEDDAFVIAGVVLVFDLNDINMSHFGQLTPAVIKKAITYCQDASPIRLKKAHIIGMPPYFRALFKLGMQVLNEKNRQKIQLHKTDELHKFISREILPIEYGGTSVTAQEIIDYWCAKLKEYEPFFQEDSQYGTDEDKRPGKPATAEALFGVDGSFRQLDFD